MCVFRKCPRCFSVGYVSIMHPAQKLLILETFVLHSSNSYLSALFMFHNVNETFSSTIYSQAILWHLQDLYRYDLRIEIRAGKSKSGKHKICLLR